MESPLPEWVNKDFFGQCLQKEEGNHNIVVTNLTVSSVVPPGNNYGSFLIRVKLDWKTNNSDTELHSSSFVVKTEITEGHMKDVTAQFGLNEPSFYYKFIPTAKQFTDISFAPRSFFSPKPNVTILEDLKERGFVMADRTKQLDFDHCHLYMIAAASFHAVSVPVFKNHSELLEPIKKESMFSNESKTRDLFILMMKGGMKKFVDEIEKVDQFKKYSKLIKDVRPHLWDMLVEAHKPGEVVNTIKQGDPWVTNMMFKYDKGGIVCDVKIIDFQAIAYGSPICDVMMFLWTSATNDVKKNKMEKLYRIYVDNFNENMKQFNCTERLTYSQMKGQIKKFSPFALFTGASWLPSLVHPDPTDMDVFFSNNENEIDMFYKKCYSNDYCENYLPHVLETLEINGVFAYLESYKSS